MGTAVKDMTVYALANLADCNLAGTATDGEQFLTGVRDAVVEAQEWAIAHHEATDLYDLAHEVADSAVPVYTYHLWHTFVDVGAFSEDVTDCGMEDVSDLDNVARTALYMIAERLAAALFGQLADEADEDDGEDVPDDYPVTVLGDDDAASDRATCGDCGRSWDDAVITSTTPVPSGRCPFEAFH